LFDISSIPEKEMPILGIYQVVTLLKKLGIKTPALLASANMEELDLENPKATISRTQELLFISSLLKEKPDPLLGLRVGCCYRLSAFGDLGMALFSSKDGRTAVDFLVRYLTLTYTYFDVRLEDFENTTVAIITAPYDLSNIYEFFLQRDLAFVATTLKDVNIAMKESAILKMEVALPKPKDTCLYDSIFNCPIRFGASVTKVYLNKRVLSTPMPMENQLTFKLHERECQKQIEQLCQQETLSDLVRREIINCEEKYPNEAQLAEKLLMSTRTFRRRLENEGTTYRKLLQDFLHKKAKMLLHSTHYSVEKIALKLGYADATSFIRAFKNWEGNTPTTYRKQYRQ